MRCMNTTCGESHGSYKLSSSTVSGPVLNQRARLPREAPINFRGGEALRAVQHGKSLNGKSLGFLKQRTITYGRRGREKVKNHWSKPACSLSSVSGPQFSQTSLGFPIVLIMFDVLSVTAHTNCFFSSSTILEHPTRASVRSYLHGSFLVSVTNKVFILIVPSLPK